MFVTTDSLAECSTFEIQIGNSKLRNGYFSITYSKIFKQRWIMEIINNWFIKRIDQIDGVNWYNGTEVCLCQLNNFMYIYTLHSRLLKNRTCTFCICPQEQRMTSGMMSGMTWSQPGVTPSQNLETVERCKEEELMQLQWKSPSTSKTEDSEFWVLMKNEAAEQSCFYNLCQALGTKQHITVWKEKSHK